jgi:hypothetical protein
VLLLRMKCRLLRLQISDHRLKPFNRDLIANGQEYAPVMLDLFIEFVALVAHGNPLEPRTEATLIGCLMMSTAGMGICSPSRIKTRTTKNTRPDENSGRVAG